MVSNKLDIAVIQTHPTTPRKITANSGFPGQWTSRGGQFAWPPRSPDFTTMGPLVEICYRHFPAIFSNKCGGAK